MNNITTSLEMSKKLKEAGWVSPTWFFANLKTGVIKPNNTVTGLFSFPDVVAAPTAEEILDKTPRMLYKDGGLYKLTILKFSNGYSVSYRGHDKIVISFKTDTLANAAAQMWTYLEENNLNIA